MKLLQNAVSVNRILLDHYIKEGMTVVDGTMGNGNDMLYFCQKVGDSGKVIGFDIQTIAVENTKRLLDENNVNTEVLLYEESHENIDAFVEEQVDMIHFNLGYLPNADKSVRTTIDTTKIAVIRSLEMLKVGGILSMVFYPGHPEGKEELRVLGAFFNHLDQQYYTVTRTSFVNQVNDPPEMIMVEKRR